MASTRALKILQTCDTSNHNRYKLAIFFALLFNQSIYVSSFQFDLIYSDIWGPSPVAIKKGSQYHVFLIDNHTRYCWFI